MQRPIKETSRYASSFPLQKGEGPKIDKQLRLLAAGKKCPRHKRKTATLAIMWADGRAWTVACSRECFLDWEESQGKWACVVRVTKL
jgi:hypothetical protein